MKLTELQDHDQRITRADLVHAMTQMGYESSTETADSILREVDFGRKGYIEFHEYLDVSLDIEQYSVVLILGFPQCKSECPLADCVFVDCSWSQGTFARICFHTSGAT